MFRSLLQQLKCIALHTREIDDMSARRHRIIRCSQGCPTQVVAKPLSHIQRQQKVRTERAVRAVVSR